MSAFRRFVAGSGTVLPWYFPARSSTDRGIGKILAHQGLRQTLVNRNVASLDMVEHTQRVIGAMLNLDVAVDRRASDQFERRMQRREHDRDGVVRSRIDVEDQLFPGHLATGIGVLFRVAPLARHAVEP